MTDVEQRHRLVVLGAERVGKSAILARFLHNAFSIQYKATIEDLHSHDFVVNGSSVKVDFLDTAGNSEFPAMRRLSISTAHAFLVVYAVDDVESFDEARRLWQEIKQQRVDSEDIPCVFAANKCDLGADRHRVSEADGLRWAESEGRCESWFEVSAKLNTAVRDIFIRLLDQARMPAIADKRGGGCADSDTANLNTDVLKRQHSGNAAQHQRNRAGGGGGGGGEKGRGGGGVGTHSSSLKGPSLPGSLHVLTVGASNDGRLIGRSRSLMRRKDKPKVKPATGNSNANDCSIC